jgi:hypothetical protein
VVRRNRQAVSGADRCLCPDVGGVHGNPRPAVTVIADDAGAPKLRREHKQIESEPTAQDLGLQRGLSKGIVVGVRGGGGVAEEGAIASADGNASAASPGVVSTRARRDGLQRGEGAGGREAFPAKQTLS